jgi:manganese transport protein
LLLFLINKGTENGSVHHCLVLGDWCSFIFKMIFAQPVLEDVMQGLIPTMPSEAALYIAIGIEQL